MISTPRRTMKMCTDPFWSQDNSESMVGALERLPDLLWYDVITLTFPSYSVLLILNNRQRHRKGGKLLWENIFFISQELCSEFQSQVRNGMLICTLENDPVQGPDGRMHGNKCTMCQSLLWVPTLLSSLHFLILHHPWVSASPETRRIHALGCMLGNFKSTWTRH